MGGFYSSSINLIILRTFGDVWRHFGLWWYWQPRGIVRGGAAACPVMSRTAPTAKYHPAPKSVLKLRFLSWWEFFQMNSHVKFTVFYTEILFCLNYSWEKSSFRHWLLGIYGDGKQTIFEKCSWRQYGDLMIQRNGKQSYFIIEGHEKFCLFGFLPSQCIYF